MRKIRKFVKTFVESDFQFLSELSHEKKLFAKGKWFFQKVFIFSISHIDQRYLAFPLLLKLQVLMITKTLPHSEMTMKLYVGVIAAPDGKPHSNPCDSMSIGNSYMSVIPKKSG